MAYFSTSKDQVGTRTTDVFNYGKPLSHTEYPNIVAISRSESRTGTVTPGWYTKSKERFVSYTRRNGTKKYFFKTTRKRRSTEEFEKLLAGYESPLVKRQPFRLNTPVNPYTYDLRVLRRSHGWGRFNGSQSTLYIGELNGTGFSADASSFVIPAADLFALENSCANKLLLKMKDQKMNAVQAIAEMDQTAKLLGTTAVRVLGMYRALKRGDLNGAAIALGVNASKRAATRYRQVFSPGNLTKSIGQGVLELQYGWDPLLSDVYGAAEAIAQANIREVRNVVRARSTRRYTVPTRSVRLINSDYTRVVDYSQTTAVVSVSMMCQFALSSSTLHSVAQMGFSNPAVILWELCPWSFVADWFIPIGNYLSTLDATMGLTFEKGSKTTFSRSYSERQVEWTAAKYSPSSSNIWQGQSASNVFDVHVKRGKLNGFPSSRPPAFKSPVGVAHAVASLALLANFIKTVR